MNRFGSGYDDLFEAFGVGGPGPGPADPGDPDPGRDAQLDPDLAPDLDPDLDPAVGDRRDESGGSPTEPAIGAPDLAAFLARAAAAARARSEDGRGLGAGGGTSAGSGVPRMVAPVDVVEVPEGLLMVFDLPGVSEGDVELAAAPRAIRVRAARRLPLPPGARSLRRERPAGVVERVVPVPRGFDAGGLEARLSSGVLAVMVPRHEASGREPGGAWGGCGEWSGD